MFESTNQPKFPDRSFTLGQTHSRVVVHRLNKVTADSRLGTTVVWGQQS